MKAKLVRIGNSRGIRLPKSVIDEVGLTEEVELNVDEGRLIIAPSRPARHGWAEAARTLRGRGDTRPLDGYIPTRFDDKEWTW